MGYGRLTRTELRTLNVIDATPTTQPYRFEGVEGLATDLWSPVGTISITDWSTRVKQVTVRLEWTQGTRGQRSFHEVQTFIASE
jgi:hypothetical protein